MLTRCVARLALLSLPLTACGGPTAPQPPAAASAEPLATSAAPTSSTDEHVVVGQALPEIIVRAALETSTSAITAGKELLLIAHLSIHPGFRVGWKNPGQVGKPTLLRFDVPEGFEVEEILWPAPDTFLLEGGLVSYGYRDEVAVFARVKPPPKLSSEQAYRFELDARWVVCQRTCLRESSKIFVELVAGQGEDTMTEELKGLLARVPRPLSDLEGVTHAVTAQPAGPSLTLSAPEVSFVGFVPEAEGVPKLKGFSPSGSGSSAVITFEEPPGNGDQSVRGVLRVHRGQAEQHFEVDIPWRKAATGEDAGVGSL